MTPEEDAPSIDEDRVDDHIHSDDEDADHCVCGVELAADEVTADAELPPATGGIAADAEREAELAAEAAEDHEDVDGCDVDFNAEEPTRDEELPQTVGG